MISVIIPTYNREKLISRALESVVNQTYKDIEIIVIDDNSNDNTEEVVREYIKRYNFIKYIKHNINKGGSSARNTGIKAAKGDFIAFLDSDDEWDLNKLEKVHDIFSKDKSIKLVYSDIYLIDEKSRKRVVDIKEKWDDPYLGLLQRNIIGGTSSIVISKDVIKNVGFFKDGLPSCQDWDFYIDIAKSNKIYSIKEPLTSYYIHLDSISGNLNRVIDGHKYILEKVSNLVDMDNKYKDMKKIIISEQYFNIAHIYSNFKEFKMAKSFYKKSLSYNIRNKRALRNVLLSILGPTVYYKVKANFGKKNKAFHEV